MEMKGKVVVVTGGGSGIGRALCLRFAHASARAVVVADLDFESAQLVAAEIGPAGFARKCDVAEASELKELVADTESEYGPIDVFCSNAGIAIGRGVESSLADWQTSIDVNLMSHVHAAKAILPLMTARGGGYLLFTASAAGLLTEVSSAPYSVTKHGVVAFAEWVSIHYGEQGIRVSCLCPQGVKTPMLDRIESPSANLLRESAISAEQVADDVMRAFEDEHFLVLPHPEVQEYFQRKANDYDRWLNGMRRLKRKLEADARS